ncbi:hypothetical protein ID856_04005 [Xenorhabdus sp. 18]|nr:hypothetical protein [Xenorhabdus sp. 18]MBD2795698.1 hypothetical protein [Xenorhabdus sp. 18]
MKKIPRPRVGGVSSRNGIDHSKDGDNDAIIELLSRELNEPEHNNTTQ